MPGGDQYQVDLDSVSALANAWQSAAHSVSEIGQRLEGLRRRLESAVPTALIDGLAAEVPLAAAFAALAEATKEAGPLAQGLARDVAALGENRANYAKAEAEIAAKLKAAEQARQKAEQGSGSGPHGGQTVTSGGGRPRGSGAGWGGAGSGSGSGLGGSCAGTGGVVSGGAAPGGAGTGSGGAGIHHSARTGPGWAGGSGVAGSGGPGDGRGSGGSGSSGSGSSGSGPRGRGSGGSGSGGRGSSGSGSSGSGPGGRGSSGSGASGSPGGSYSDGSAGGAPVQPPGPAQYANQGQVEDWIDQAFQVLEADGVPASELDRAGVLLIIEHESAGNPNAINDWDSNAQAGDPSRGLMQTIGATFDAYKLPGHDDIYDPVDNIIAGVRYALSRYGSIQNVPGVRSVDDGGSYVGY